MEAPTTIGENLTTSVGTLWEPELLIPGELRSRYPAEVAHLTEVDRCARAAADLIKGLANDASPNLRTLDRREKTDLLEFLHSGGRAGGVDSNGYPVRDFEDGVYVDSNFYPCDNAFVNNEYYIISPDVIVSVELTLSFRHGLRHISIEPRDGVRRGTESVDAFHVVMWYQSQESILTFIRQFVSGVGATAPYWSVRRRFPDSVKGPHGVTSISSPFDCSFETARFAGRDRNTEVKLELSAAEVLSRRL